MAYASGRTWPPTFREMERPAGSPIINHRPSNRVDKSYYYKQNQTEDNFCNYTFPRMTKELFDIFIYHIFDS